MRQLREVPESPTAINAPSPPAARHLARLIDLSNVAVRAATQIYQSDFKNDYFIASLPNKRVAATIVALGTDNETSSCVFVRAVRFW
jgi:hypothetical protein